MVKPTLPETSSLEAANKHCYTLFSSDAKIPKVSKVNAMKGCWFSYTLPHVFRLSLLLLIGYPYFKNAVPKPTTSDTPVMSSQACLP